MKSISEDLRKRIVKAREKGESAAEVSKRFAVSLSSVGRYWRAYAQHGHCRPKQRGGYRRSRLEDHTQTIRSWIAERADLTLWELQKRCRQELSVKIGLNALWHQLDQLGLSYKKNDARRRAAKSRRERGPGKLAQGTAQLEKRKSGLHR
jgi:transposase